MRTKVGILIFTFMIAFSNLSGQIIQKVELPSPKKIGGMPLFEALNNRKSLRDFTDQDLDMQTISNLLWAAFGINREDGKRTAPTARDWQHYDIYAVTSGGWYVYDAENHTLLMMGRDDKRSYAGRQEFVHNAPLTLIFVADSEKMGGVDDSMVDFYASVNVGFISQNVYLFAASEGLGTCVLGLIDRELISKEFRLRPTQKVILSQTIGFPR